MTPMCDICGAAMTVDQRRVYPPADFRSLVEKGFAPDDRTLDIVAVNWNVPRAEAMAYWRTKIVPRSPTDWSLCEVCYTRAKTFQPAPKDQLAQPSTVPVAKNAFWDNFLVQFVWGFVSDFGQYGCYSTQRLAYLFIQLCSKVAIIAILGIAVLLGHLCGSYWWLVLFGPLALIVAMVVYAWIVHDGYLACDRRGKQQESRHQPKVMQRANLVTNAQAVDPALAKIAAAHGHHPGAYADKTDSDKTFDDWRKEGDAWILQSDFNRALHCFEQANRIKPGDKQIAQYIEMVRRQLTDG